MNVRSSPAKSVMESQAEYAKNFSAAVSMEKARRFFEARQLYLAAVKAKPGDGAALEGAARMAAAAGEHRTAIEHLRAALASDPKRNTARERLIGGLLHVGELASAEEEAQIALDLAPNEVALLNMLGVIQKRRGRFAEAMETFRKGIAREPLNHSPWYNLGNTYLTIGDFAQAVEAMKLASELTKDSETSRLYGQALIGTGEHEIGMAVFARAQQLDPKNSPVYTSRAVPLQRIGAPDAAVLSEIAN